MPYIVPVERVAIDRIVHDIPYLMNGEMNYFITKVLLTNKDFHNYQSYMEIVGTLECVKLEMYRRAIATYEDNKKEENGDVY